MFLFPNAKINIGLNVIDKTNSGYHNLESCFCPITLYDVIEINERNSTSLSLSGIKIKEKNSDNIILKASKFFEDKSKFKIHLHKNIPIGAGLGGGSSDASFVINFLNQKFQLYNDNDLIKLSNEIGSDCPFFLENKIKLVYGTGNIFEDVKLDLKDKYILIVNPNKGISTHEAYKNIKPSKPKFNLREVLENENLENWQKYIKNDFESFAFSKIEELETIKKDLINLGAKYVSLTGSGSCFYGIFNSNEIIDYSKYQSFLVKSIN